MTRYKNYNQNNNEQYAWMFLAGLGAGAIAGLLFAPKAGSELRADAAERFSNSRKNVLKAVDDSIENVRHTVDRQLAVVDHTVKQGVAAFQEAREVFADA
jgi:gas vesicle protein